MPTIRPVFSAPVAVVVPAQSVQVNLQGGSFSVDIPAQTIVTSASIPLDELKAALAALSTS